MGERDEAFADLDEPQTTGEITVKIYVGNMSFNTSEDGLRAAFAEHGAVDEVNLITDRDTGRPRGFAFLTMPDNDARGAIEAMNGKELDGRTLVVNEAHEKGGRGGGGRGRGGDRRGGW